MAAAQYEANNDGYLPLPFRRSGDPAKDFTRSPLEEWTDKLPPYLGMKSMSALINVVPTSKLTSPLICPTQYRLKSQMVTSSQNHNPGGESMLSSRLQYPIKRSMGLSQEGAANGLSIGGSIVSYFMDGWLYESGGRYTT